MLEIATLKRYFQISHINNFIDSFRIGWSESHIISRFKIGAKVDFFNLNNTCLPIEPTSPIHRLIYLERADTRVQLDVARVTVYKAKVEFDMVVGHIHGRLHEVTILDHVVAINLWVFEAQDVEELGDEVDGD